MADLEKIKEELKREFPHGHPDFIALTLEELDLHSKKNRDYSFGGNPLGNFTRVAAILSNYPNLKLNDPTIVALVYLFKQLDAVLWLLNTDREGQVEGVDERLKDIHVYAKLARILYKERKNGKKNK
jgi:hypothetical protein